MRPSRSWLTRVLPALVAVALAGVGCAEGSDPSNTDPSVPASAEATFPLTLVDDDGVEVTGPAAAGRVGGGAGGSRPREQGSRCKAGAVAPL